MVINHVINEDNWENFTKPVVAQASAKPTAAIDGASPATLQRSKQATASENATVFAKPTPAKSKNQDAKPVTATPISATTNVAAIRTRPPKRNLQSTSESDSDSSPVVASYASRPPRAAAIDAKHRILMQSMMDIDS
jgi:hypothetical protein